MDAIDVSDPVSTVDEPFASDSAAAVVVVDAVVVVGSVEIVAVEMAEAVMLLDWRHGDYRWMG